MIFDQQSKITFRKSSAPPAERGEGGAGGDGDSGNTNSRWPLLKSHIFILFYIDNLKILGLKYSQYYLNMLIKFNEI